MVKAPLFGPFMGTVIGLSEKRMEELENGVEKELSRLEPPA